MIPGQYVTTPDGRVGQLARIISTSINGPAGAIPAPADQYVTVVDGAYVSATLPDEKPWWWTEARWNAVRASTPRLLPSCGVCGARPGYPCAATCPAGHLSRAARGGE